MMKRWQCHWRCHEREWTLEWDIQIAEDETKSKYERFLTTMNFITESTGEREIAEPFFDFIYFLDYGILLFYLSFYYIFIFSLFNDENEYTKLLTMQTITWILIFILWDFRRNCPGHDSANITLDDHTGTHFGSKSLIWSFFYLISVIKSETSTSLTLQNDLFLFNQWNLQKVCRHTQNFIYIYIKTENQYDRDDMIEMILNNKI